MKEMSQCVNSMAALLYHTVIPPPAPRTGDKDHQPKPAHRGTEGVGQGPGKGRQRASWRRPSSPQARKDRHSWKSWWSWDQAPSSCPGASRAARSSLPNPSSALPARTPSVAPPGGPQLAPPMFGQSGSGLHGGPRHSRQATKPRQGCRPARPRPRPHPSEGCFSHPDTSPVDKQSPLEFTKTNAPTVSSAQAKTGLPRRLDSKPSLQAQPPERHMTLLFREAPECALFWVPRALMLPDAPYRGSKLSQVPKGCPEGDQWTSCSATAPHPSPGKGATGSQGSGV